MNTKTKYDQLNVLTIIAMIMIFCIHYFNNFGKGVSSESAKLIVSFLRGFALIAVPIFVANISYTHLFLEKKVSFKKLVLYIVIPTILLTQFNSIIVDKAPITWNLKGGFSGSWFGDMYIGLMLSTPLIQKIYSYRSNKLFSNLLFIAAVFVSILAYYLSITRETATLMNLGILVFIPYISMFIIYDYILFRIDFKNTRILVLLMIFGIACQMFAYYPSGILENKFWITSYFSPFSYLYTFAIFKLIYNSNFKINNIRNISQTSYFFYFAHYTILGILINNFKDITTHNVLMVFPIGLISAFVLSLILYYIYKLIIKILQLEGSDYSV